MLILARNWMSFWRENSNVVKVRLKKLTFKTFSPLIKKPMPTCPTIASMPMKMSNSNKNKTKLRFRKLPIRTLNLLRSLQKSDEVQENTRPRFQREQALPDSQSWRFQVRQSSTIVPTSKDNLASPSWIQPLESLQTALQDFKQVWPLGTLRLRLCFIICNFLWAPQQTLYLQRAYNFWTIHLLYLC